jgi:hypothetical protein
MRRIADLLWQPRSTMAALVARPQFLLPWLVVLAVWLVPAAWLLSTPVGLQAVVDEQVRMTESFGGRVDDAAYEQLRQSPPWTTYAISGGRALLAPPVTVLVAFGLMLLARLDGAPLRLPSALSVVVAATVVLALREALMTPVFVLRESITSATNLAALLPSVDEGSVAARFLGTIDVFALWWTWLLALGVSSASGRPARRYLLRLVAVYLGMAALIAGVMAFGGGS